ncbi:hypothetical protein SAMN06295933_1754 [Desulfovibrio gilichinskyi]|uniref:Uncharacterized protein n=1 Tax=Desulfovibrio gilichinskyi TaxID=1519643 RepID=A0A1X7DCJ2_9BACT|nr:hypothetical protein SAMN06295933_1754 [Desulfovibrio gilichinskyi]
MKCVREEGIQIKKALFAFLRKEPGKDLYFIDAF